MVWCAVAAFAIIGPYFFEDECGHACTVTSEHYAHTLHDFLIPRLQGLPVNKTIYFRQDGATSHTAKIAMNVLRPLFSGHLISRYGDIAWTARSPDLSVCDFYLWSHLKSVVNSAPSLHTTHELKLRIREEISRIPVDVLCRAMSSVHDWLAECEQRNGGRLEDVILRVDWCVVFFMFCVMFQGHQFTYFCKCWSMYFLINVTVSWYPIILISFNT